MLEVMRSGFKAVFVCFTQVSLSTGRENHRPLMYRRKRWRSTLGFVQNELLCPSTSPHPLSPFFAVCKQDPDVLATNHDQQLHADLSTAWQIIQVDERLPRPGAPIMEVELA